MLPIICLIIKTLVTFYQLNLDKKKSIQHRCISIQINNIQTIYRRLLLPVERIIGSIVFHNIRFMQLPISKLTHSHFQFLLFSTLYLRICCVINFNFVSAVRFSRRDLLCMKRVGISVVCRQPIQFIMRSVLFQTNNKPSYFIEQKIKICIFFIRL